MPTYDYECLKCGETFEAFQKMSEPLIKNCPVCRGKVKRLIGTGAGLIFKGSGFYATDYKNKKNDSSKEKNPTASTSEGASQNNNCSSDCPQAKSCSKQTKE